MSLTSLKPILACLLLFAPATCLAGSIDLGLEADFAVGDYGTGDNNDSVTVAFQAGWMPVESVRLTLWVPYISQGGDGTVRMGPGRYPHGHGQGEGMMGGSGAMSGHGMGMGSGSSGGNGLEETRTGRQAGLGDMTLDAEYLILGSERLPDLTLLGYLKLPTGDEEKGLGTGGFDYGAGLGLGQLFGSVYLFGEAVYVLPSGSIDFDPRNYLMWRGGGAWKMTPSFQVGLGASGATAPFQDQSGALEIEGEVSCSLGRNWFLKGFLSTGLSDASPDFGGGLQVSWLL